MTDEADPALTIVASLKAIGIEAELIDDEVERWRIGDFILSDADVERFAAGRKSVGSGEDR
ncbi:hypothetical protein MKK65_08220 [Methylobacterium sp. J-001]|uniref:hypothetical protein n=1 Tax=Methylobacterium sp. J-001 TaxID=2836609 RepID=UPI001FB92691|nr:hypothetical protein [Methylobacterium sp. J-001]MCJ2116564.1 hypothetical protein [Methylobacterium sp. J-001]